MKFNSGIFVGNMSFFWSGITTKINNLFLKGYFGFVWFFFKPFFKCNSFKAQFISCLAICSIFSIAGQSQIFNPIIRSIPVNMIYLAFWPFSGCIKPCKSMASVMFSVNFSVYISFFAFITYQLTNLYFGSGSSPKKIPGFSFIPHYLGKFFVANFAHKKMVSHFSESKKD